MEPGKQYSPPPWFEEVELDQLAERLNPLLQEQLQEHAPDGLWADVAARLEIWQMDTYHLEASNPPGEELARITEVLNTELRRLLVEDYGADQDEVQYAVVRRWGLLAAVENPDCKWHKCWDGDLQQWCWWRECCPCV